MVAARRCRRAFLLLIFIKSLPAHERFHFASDIARGPSSMWTPETLTLAKGYGCWSGEGVPPKAGEPSVHFRVVRRFSHAVWRNWFHPVFKNHIDVTSRCRLFPSHRLIPLFLIFFSRLIASERVSQFIKPTNTQGIPCLLLSVEPELWSSRRSWRLFVWPQ